MKTNRWLILTILPLFAGIQTWAQNSGWMDLSSNLPEQVGFSDVFFVGEAGWITGGNSKLYYTSDGGQTFTIQQLPENSGITNAIHMLGASEGYLVTSTGEVFQSTDAGNGNWVPIPPGTSAALFAISFPPGDTVGYACGNGGNVYKVTPSKVTLDQHVSPDTWLSVCFPVNSDEGWVTGGSLRHRIDGSWQADQLYASGDPYFGVYLVDNLNGWMVGGSGPGVIRHTVDGNLWNGQYNPDTETSHILNDVFFIDQYEGWIAGVGVILHTTDGSGTPEGNWQIEAQDLTSGKHLRAVYATDNKHVYVVGNNTFLKYSGSSGIREETVPPASIRIEGDHSYHACSQVRIQIDVKHSTILSLKVFDVSGHELSTLIDGERKAGSFTVNWQTAGLNSGIYLVRLQAGNHQQTIKFLLR